MSTEKIHNYQFPPGTTISSKVRNSCRTVPVSNFQMNTRINPGTSQNTMTSNEKWNNIYDANGESLNHPFDIVNSVATRNIAHNTEDHIAGSTQSWQNFHQQQLIGNHLVHHEIANNIEPNLFVQQYRTKTINDCHFASVNQLLGQTKKYKADHLQLNHSPLPKQFITATTTKMKFPNCLVQQFQCLMITVTQILLIFLNYRNVCHNQFQKI